MLTTSTRTGKQKAARSVMRKREEIEMDQQSIEDIELAISVKRASMQRATKRIGMEIAEAERTCAILRERREALITPFVEAIKEDQKRLLRIRDRLK